jgi:hypothetical protein
MDEHAEPRPAEEEPPAEQPQRPPGPPLTQRELVRASLLRCPPEQAGEPPRH